MTLHTSQHLLSSLLDKVSLPTLSWSLTPHPAPCYIEIPRAPTLDEITQVEKEANKLIRESTKVWIEVDDQQAQQESEENRKSSRSIPKDYEGGVVRTVCINGVDRNPCCGTHTPSLALLQALHIIPTVSACRILSFSHLSVLILYTPLCDINRPPPIVPLLAVYTLSPPIGLPSTLRNQLFSFRASRALSETPLLRPSPIGFLR